MEYLFTPSDYIYFIGVFIYFTGTYPIFSRSAISPTVLRERVNERLEDITRRFLIEDIGKFNQIVIFH
ncbi:hypothetical protein G9463_12830 [Haloarcula sp. JP-Z28]|uniref:Uncharacterized protein n=2 Tax=Haloarcula TaxID=2237 RepID=M0JNS8_9EURY|nr:hypothetical protein SG26_19420 [Haloarcula sp. CBA1115]EMA09614.1 hypothetical protein C436_18861 [Haloarcula sinaiiensis ATCC 33800]EMA14018.1 hypothetical protein C442_20586 [Haloarcula amylolytica JCM 13557]NHN64178.1 hypothetical protein [Haloarcula sp. JP-Z28]